MTRFPACDRIPRPAERFFLAIKEGDTPETSEFAKLACEWSELWLANMTNAFAPIAAA